MKPFAYIIPLASQCLFSVQVKLAGEWRQVVDFSNLPGDRMISTKALPNFGTPERQFCGDCATAIGRMIEGEFFEGRCEEYRITSENYPTISQDIVHWKSEKVKLAKSQADLVKLAGDFANEPTVASLDRLLNHAYGHTHFHYHATGSPIAEVLAAPVKIKLSAGIDKK